MITRRSLFAIGTAVLAMPAIVRASNLMSIVLLPPDPRGRFTIYDYDHPLDVPNYTSGTCKHSTYQQVLRSIDSKYKLAFWEPDA